MDLSGAAPGVGEAVALFDASRYNQRLGPVYDVSAPPEQFLLIREGTSSAGVEARRELRLIQHWGREIARLLPGVP